jgi:hypothetical protein
LILRMTVTRSVGFPKDTIRKDASENTSRAFFSTTVVKSTALRIEYVVIITDT